MIHPTRRVVLTCAVWCGTRMCAWDCGVVVVCRVVWCGIIGVSVSMKGKNKMSFMNLKALYNSIDFNVNSIYDVFVYFG